MSTQQRREQDRARRKDDILRAARAVIAQEGYRRATVSQIAQRAEVAKGTIYLYFDGKEAILAELVLCALRELGGLLEAVTDRRSMLRPDEKLRGMAEVYLSFAQNSPDYYRLLTAFDRGAFESGLNSERRLEVVATSNHTLDLVAQAISDGMRLGIFTSGDPRRAAGVIWAALNGALALMAHPVRRALFATDAPGLYRATLELCIRGLTEPPPSERRIT